MKMKTTIETPMWYEMLKKSSGNLQRIHCKSGGKFGIPPPGTQSARPSSWGLRSNVDGTQYSHARTHIHR